jgi:hypothetical protein
MGGPAYVLDANVFIEAARRYYAFDLVPNFWATLVHLGAAGHIVSIDRVKDELLKGKDDLAAWIADNFTEAIASTNETTVINCYSEVITWVAGQDQYMDAAKDSFADGADGWLVAYARCTDRIVVTHEQPRDNIRKGVPIPNVCNAFNVPYTNTFGMLRDLKIKL